MFSSSGVLFGNYTSIVSNMLKASKIHQKFDAVLSEGSDTSQQLNLILPESTDTPEFLRFSSEIIYRLYTGSFDIKACSEFFNVEECKFQTNSKVTINPEEFQHNKYAYLVNPANSEKDASTEWNFNYE
jgi:hypothetical protein